MSYLLEYEELQEPILNISIDYYYDRYSFLSYSGAIGYIKYLHAEERQARSESLRATIEGIRHHFIAAARYYLMRDGKRKELTA